MIVSKEKRSGFGTKILSLFCRLMESLSSPGFVAQAVSKEGAMFFNKLEKRGQIDILSRGKDWLIRCLEF